ncbi:hypothetical protein [Methylobacterium sp. CM6257]|jgi:hypothetical protein
MSDETWQEAICMSAAGMAYMSGRETLRETVVASSRPADFLRIP